MIHLQGKNNFETEIVVSLLIGVYPHTPLLGADPVGIGVGVTLSCLHNILYSERIELAIYCELEQVDGVPSHIPAPSHISMHIEIPNAFLQFSSRGLLPVTVSRF